MLTSIVMCIILYLIFHSKLNRVADNKLIPAFQQNRELEELNLKMLSSMNQSHKQLCEVVIKMADFMSTFVEVPGAADFDEEDEEPDNKVSVLKEENHTPLNLTSPSTLVLFRKIEEMKAAVDKELGSDSALATKLNKMLS